MKLLKTYRFLKVMILCFIFVLPGIVFAGSNHFGKHRDQQPELEYCEIGDSGIFVFCDEQVEQNDSISDDDENVVSENLDYCEIGNSGIFEFC